MKQDLFSFSNNIYSFYLLDGRSKSVKYWIWNIPWSQASSWFFLQQNVWDIFLIIWLLQIQADLLMQNCISICQVKAAYFISYFENENYFFEQWIKQKFGILILKVKHVLHCVNSQQYFLVVYFTYHILTRFSTDQQYW